MRIYRFNNHDQSLRIWRRLGIRGQDLVHIDAHIDLEPFLAESVQDVLRSARNKHQLIAGLSAAASYRRTFGDVFGQVNVGNYIYPAIKEGIVRDLYWVVPGTRKTFSADRAVIRDVFRRLGRSAQGVCQGRGGLSWSENEGMISVRFMGRKLVACVLETIPKLTDPTLVDIDTDFLVIGSVRKAGRLDDIARRKRWIRPHRLVLALNDAVKKPSVVTIAYSLDGGFTPAQYKVLGDELAYRFAPGRFSADYGEKLLASSYFDRFQRSGKEEYYRKAVTLEPLYRSPDNSYGFLYLAKRRYGDAAREFRRILHADPGNVYALAGVGQAYLGLRRIPAAVRFLERASAQCADTRFSGVIQAALCRAYLKGGDAEGAALALAGLTDSGLAHPQLRCLAGMVAEARHDPKSALAHYCQALRWGWNDPAVIRRAARIILRLPAKRATIFFIRGCARRAGVTL